MVTYAQDIWRCRYFWMSLVKMDLQNRYRRSVLGIGWSLLNPIAMTTVMCIVFVKVFGQDLREFAPSLMAGLAIWTYVVTSMLNGCQCFFIGEQYIRQYPAPLAIYPLRTALGGTIHFGLALLVVFALAVYAHATAPLPVDVEGPMTEMDELAVNAHATAPAPAVTDAVRAARAKAALFHAGVPGPAALLSLIPAIVLLFLFGWSVALLAGFANVIFKDTQHLAEVGLQIVFYASPIIVPKEVFVKNGLTWILTCNPVVAFLDMIRIPLLEGHVPHPMVFAKAMVTVGILMLASGLMLLRQQKRLIFYL